MGANGMHPHRGPLLRPEERTRSGRALVCRQRARRPPWRAFSPRQRCAALPRPRLQASEHRPSASRPRDCRSATKLCRHHRRRDHGPGNGRVDGEKIRQAQTHLGAGPRDGERGEHRLPARTGARYIVGTPRLSSRPSRQSCWSKRIGKKSSPASKSSWWPIPTARPRSNTCSADRAHGGRRNWPCSKASGCGCVRSWTKPTRASCAVRPKSRAKSNAASGAGSGAIPPPSVCSKSRLNATQKAVPAD